MLMNWKICTLLVLIGIAAGSLTQRWYDNLGKSAACGEYSSSCIEN